MSYSIGFIGGGKMAEAIISGLVSSELVPRGKIQVSDIDENRLDYLRDKYGVGVVKGNEKVVAGSDVVVLAVKPQVLQEVVLPLREVFTAGQLVISIAAGITINKLSSWLPDGQPIVRVMPNTPCLIGEGISAIACGKAVSEDQAERAREILASVGEVIVIEEKYLNAVTGLSGSGPAYIYLIIEALADAGVMVGLDRATALKLAVQTVIGSARMVQETGQHPAQLREAVTSPGGTTVAALHTLEHGRLRGVLMDAVLVATSRAAELSGE